MKTTLLIIFTIITNKSLAEDRYAVKYVEGYLVGTLHVVDNESDKTGWDRIVSRPYGAGPAVRPYLDRMVWKWNIQGIRPEDERNLAIILERNGLFAFPKTTGPQP